MANINSIKLPDGTTYDINAKTVAGKTVQTDVPANAVFTDTTYSPFTGTDGTEAGVAGLVPAPSVSDVNKVLKSDGTWTSAGANNAVTQTASDSNDAEYELLFSETADNTTHTEGARKTQYAKINPSKQAFTFGQRKVNYSAGEYSLVEGFNNIASGQYSHAEGYSTEANTLYSHAEGINTTASGYSSHAEGGTTIASGNGSHAEGLNTTASGYSSHAEGLYTIAQRKSQHVFGEYNIADTQGTTTERGDYVEIVGNGSYDSTRPEGEETIYSNARTLDWDGNEELAGNLQLAGMSSDISLTGSGNTWDGTNTSLKAAISGIFDAIYPIGSIYMSVNNVNPSTLFGGTWEALEDGYVLKTITSGTAGTTNSAGKTGGTTLTAAQSGVPAHSHEMTQATYKVTSSGKVTDGISGGGHTHVIHGYAGTTDRGAVTAYQFKTGSGADKTGIAIDGTAGWSAKAESTTHTHTLPNHTHTVSINTDASIKNNTAKAATSSHNHTAGMPQNIGVYVWKRTA